MMELNLYIKKQILLLSFILIAICIQAQPTADTLAYWPLDEGSNIFTNEVESGAIFFVLNNRPSTEWESGVKGNALRTNGYASWAEGSLSTNLPSLKTSLSCWVAIESYPVANASFFSHADLVNPAGIRLGLNKYGTLIGSAVVNGTWRHLEFSNPLPQYEWVHLLFTVDGTSGEMTLYVNGQFAAQKNVPSGSIASPTSVTTYIGRNTEEEFVGIFNTNVFNGLIDEVVLYDDKLSSTDAQFIYNDAGTINALNLEIPASRFAADIQRPRYHSIPASAWANESHGLIFHNGKYHIFYQKNANGPYWSHINWGHLTSEDLLVWQEERPVLAPTEGAFDSYGMWSGTCIIDDNNTPTIVYTGVDGVKAGVGIATGNADLSEFQKYTGNPVISSPPGTFPNRDFRDPFVFKENDSWYLLIGSGLTSAGTGGTVFLYKSDDLVNWDFLRPMHTGYPSSTDSTGIFWEMPMFVKFDDKYALIVNRVPDNGALARTFYWIGEFREEKFFPDFAGAKNFEIVNHLLAPTVSYSAAGEPIAIGIIPDERNPIENFNAGWAHTFSIPRVLSLSADKTRLLQKPWHLMYQLRDTVTAFQNISIPPNQSGNIPGTYGRQIEILTRITPGSATKVGMVIAKDPNGSEETRLYYDYFTTQFVIDKTNSSTNSNTRRDTRSGVYPLNIGEAFDLRIFFDGSALEVFVNEEATFSSRIFPTTTGDLQMDFFAEGGTATADFLEIWNLKSMSDPTVSIEELENPLAGLEVQAFPNPFSDKINMELMLDQPVDWIEWSIYNLNGQLIDVIRKENPGTGKLTLDWKADSSLTTQMVFHKIEIQGIGSKWIKTLKH